MSKVSASIDNRGAGAALATDREADAAPSAPISVQDIRALGQILSDFGLSELTLTRAGGDHLCLRREVAAPAAHSPAGFVMPPGLAVHGHGPAGILGAPPRAPEAAPPAREKSSLVAVTSPFVGTFYRSANPDAPPFVEVGQRVRKGQTLCIIEAMKLMNELESDIDGVVAECPVQNGRPVEYGQALFQIDVG